MEQKKKKLGKESAVLLIVSSLLVIGIVLILTLVIIPKSMNPSKVYEYKGDEFDFSQTDFTDSKWICDLAEQKIAFYEADFIQDMAFTYSEDEGYLSVTYVSGQAADATRTYYMRLLENAVAGDGNTEALLNISGEISGTEISIKNYFSDVTNLYKITFTLQEETVGYIKNLTGDMYPTEMLSNIHELAYFMEGGVYGGYVLYNMNEYSETSYDKVPIASRAYFTNDDLDNYMKNLKDTHSLFDEFRLVEEKNAAYGKKDGYLIRLGFVVNQKDQALSTISAQKIPEDIETK